MTTERAAPPLAGRRILVTRRPEQSGSLATRLAELGASVVEIATIAIVPPEDFGPLDRALRELHRYDWLVFTSANAVRSVRARLDALGLDPTPVGRGTPVAAVGPSTTEAFREHFPGGEVGVQPEREFRAEGLAEAFAARGVRGRRFLLPVSDRARGTLAADLTAAGAEVSTVVSYRTVTPAGMRERLTAELEAGLDLATFASPSAVEGFTEAARDLAGGLAAAVIGPVTERAAHAAGMKVVVIASPSTADGLVAAIVRHFGSPGTRS